MNVNENNIRPDLFDILKGNHNIGFTVQKSQKLITAWYHNLADAAAAGIKFQVTHPPQLSAVLYIDDILTF